MKVTVIVLMIPVEIMAGCAVLGMIFNVYIQNYMKFYHKFVEMVFYILYGLKIFD